MKKTIALLLATLLLAGCSQDSSVIGIIGGADGPTSIIVAGDPLPKEETSSSESEAEAPPESESQPESKPASSSSQPESKAESKPAVSSSQPESKPAVSSTADSGETAQYSLSTTKVKAGNMVTFTAKGVSSSDIVMTATVGGSRKLFDNGDDVVGYIGVSRNAELGNYKVVITDSAGKVTELPFSVVDAGFASESFEMAQGTVNNTVNSTAARDEYNRITASVMALDTGEPDAPRLDSFVFPLQVDSYRVSSSYGFTRIVNGKVSGRHEGVDFPAPKGTQVLAAGSGRVLYSGPMQMTGNTVIIEHGMGLKSWYHHMDSLDCETGDVLEAGDPVGKVGTTGYSTGNHLHFGMSVFDTYTNPWQFIPEPK